MKSSPQSSITSDIVITIVSHFTILLTSFLQTTLLLRILNLELFGIYGVFTSSFALGFSLSMLGIDTTLTRLISKNQEKYLGYFGDIFSLTIIISIATATLFYFFLFFSSIYIYNDPGLMQYLQFTVIGLFSAIYSTFFTALLRGLSEMKRIAFVTIVARSLGLLIAFILIISFNLLGGIIAYLNYYFLELLFLSFVVYRIKKVYKFKFKFGVSKSAFRLIMKHGSAYYFLTIIVMFSFWLGIAILDRISGHGDVGIYQVGQYIFAILQQIGHSLVFVLFPKISSLSANKSDLDAQFQNFLCKALKFSFLTQFLLGITFITFHDVFLILFNVSGDARTTIIAFIVISPIIFGVGFILIDTTLFGMSEFRVLFFIRFTFLFSYLLSAVVFIYILGPLGLVTSMLIAWIMQIIIAIFHIKRKYLTSLSIKDLMYKPLIVLFFYFISYSSCIFFSLTFPVPLNLIMCILIFITALSFVLLFILNPDDRETIKSLLKTN